MKHTKFKNQICYNALRKMKTEDDEIFSLEDETKPSRLENKRLRDQKHENAKAKKYDKWN